MGKVIRSLTVSPRMAAITFPKREENGRFARRFHARISRLQCLRMSSAGRRGSGSPGAAKAGFSPEHGHTPHAGFQGVRALGLHYNLKPCYHFEFTAPGFMAVLPKSLLEIA
jgi:hypothetical protein